MHQLTSKASLHVCVCVSVEANSAQRSQEARPPCTRSTYSQGQISEINIETICLSDSRPAKGWDSVLPVSGVFALEASCQAQE